MEIGQAVSQAGAKMQTASPAGMSDILEKPSAAPDTTPSARHSTQRMSGTRSAAATNCISDVPGLVKQVVILLLTSVLNRLSAPFMIPFPYYRKQLTVYRRQVISMIYYWADFLSLKGSASFPYQYNPVQSIRRITIPSRRQLANAIRALSMDAVQRAKSGHPGAPMGMADIAEVLWNDFFRHNPANPGWADRDRFVMSNGHGSMLLYSILHLTGYDLPMEELKNFRQLHSKTPGHPEYGYTPGIETTTGPLGQGLANAVGMAIAERTLAAQFNRDGLDIVDHYTYASVGDGCLMEGISHEACSLAGTLGLGKLIVIYDSNQISIDGEVKGWFTEDIPQRFNAYQWHVIPAIDGHDPEAVRQAVSEAQAVSDKPSILCCNTIIGLGSPNKQGKASSHGAPLGTDEVALVRETIDWSWPEFEIPADIYRGWDARQRGAQLEAAWDEKFSDYAKRYPEDAAEFLRRVRGDLPGTGRMQAAPTSKPPSRKRKPLPRARRHRTP